MVYDRIACFLWAKIFMLILLVLAGCGSEQKASLHDSSINQPSKVASVVREPLLVEVAGTVRSSDVAVLSTRFAAFVSQVPATTGNRVKKGEVLMIIDEKNLLAQREKLKAVQQEVALAINESKHHREAARAQQELARQTFDRIAALYEKKAASNQEYDEALTRKAAAEAVFQGASERVAQTEAKARQVASDLKELSATYAYSRIEAPFDGLVTSVQADAGTFVNPGQPLVVLEKTSAYQVIFSVEEEMLSAFKPGSRLIVKIPVLDGRLWEAVAAEVSPSIDAATRAFQVKANLTSDAALQSGLSAVLLVQIPERSALWIPIDFLNRKGDIETVVVREQGRWRRVLVKSGVQRGDKVQILSGLAEGEVIGLVEVSG